MEHATRYAAMFAALGHEARVRIVRLVLAAHPDGLVAGEIQQWLGLPASTTSFLGALNHLGIQVASTEAVEEAKRRVEAAGLATWEERNTDCCYALQDKIWVTDPNGYRWEVFVVKAVTGEEGRGKGNTAKTCCAAGGGR